MSNQRRHKSLIDVEAPFISIILASNRPGRLLELFDNLEATSANPGSFEVLIKVDSEDMETCAVVEDAIAKRPFPITTMITPHGEGYYALHHAYQALLEKANTESYFVILMNDEVRFISHGWDDIFRRYIGYFPDDIFRLRISDNRARQYRSLEECCAYPENFSVTTRVWYEVTEGMGDLWGPDSWHQAIEYMLGKTLGLENKPTLTRGINIDEIKLKGTQASVGAALPEVYDKGRRVSIRWRDLNGWQGQENFSRLAARLSAYIHTQAKGYTNFTISEDTANKVIRTHADKSGTDIQVGEISYKVSFVGYCAEIFNRFKDPERNSAKYWFLKVVLNLPRLVRVLLEPMTGNVLLIALNFRNLFSHDIENLFCIDEELKQLQRIDKKTGKVIGVISYRLK